MDGNHRLPRLLPGGRGMIKVSETAEKILTYCDASLIQKAIKDAIMTQQDAGRESGVSLDGPYNHKYGSLEYGFYQIGERNGEPVSGILVYNHLTKSLTGTIRVGEKCFSERKITILGSTLPIMISSQLQDGSRKLEEFIEINLYAGRRVISVRQSLGSAVILLNVGEINKDLSEEYLP